MESEIKTASEVRPVTERQYRDRGDRSCRHQWRLIENFFIEIDRNHRDYAAYCAYCLESRTVKIEKN